MGAVASWALGVGFAIYVCRMLWKARRDAQIRKKLAASMAADLGEDSTSAPEDDAPGPLASADGDVSD